MMGRQDRDQRQLFYEFSLDEVVPKDHLLRRMNVFVTGVLADVHQHLKPFYSDIGRTNRQLSMGAAFTNDGKALRVHLDRAGSAAPRADGGQTTPGRFRGANPSKGTIGSSSIDLRAARVLTGAAGPRTDLPWWRQMLKPPAAPPCGAHQYGARHPWDSCARQVVSIFQS
jgi:hypothetical protein